jgi:hypothetical protein
MIDSQIPVSGSLRARIIRACTVHAQCSLECPERRVEDLGQVATFDKRSMMQKLKENYVRWRASSQTSAKQS